MEDRTRSPRTVSKITALPASLFRFLLSNRALLFFDENYFSLQANGRYTEMRH